MVFCDENENFNFVHLAIDSMFTTKTLREARQLSLGNITKLANSLLYS